MAGWSMAGKRASMQASQRSIGRPDVQEPARTGAIGHWGKFKSFAAKLDQSVDVRARMPISSLAVRGANE